MSSEKTKKYPLAQQLLFASAKGSLHEVIKLLQDGATLAVNKHGRTALHIAAHRGYLDIVRTLLQAGCSPDIQDDNGETALHRAVTAGHEKIVQRLLDESCNVDCQNNFGDTALHEASRCGHSRIVKCLIKSNANFQCQNKNKDVPLHMACANGHATSTQQLLCVTSLTSPFNKQKDTPLHLAVKFGHCTCSRLLIGSNCEINSQNKFGDTPLHIATVTRSRKLVRILLDANAEAATIRNSDGKSPIDLAKDMENGELVLMLMSGARPQNQRHRGRSLHKSFPAKHRSQSDPHTTARNRDSPAQHKISDPASQNSSEECRADSSLKRTPEKIKTKKKHLPMPESHRYHRQSVSSRRNHTRHSYRTPTMCDYQKSLVVNPYVVPQLYSLHRDETGKIRQTPVVNHLPNPTPQIVNKLHQSIEQVKDEWKHNLDDATSSLVRKIEEVQHQTEYRLKSLDKVTSERINAERIMCLHRIDQRAAQERGLWEESMRSKLHNWVGKRTKQSVNGMDKSIDLKPAGNAISISTSNNVYGDENHQIPAKKKIFTKKTVHSPNGNAESEVRSLDSGFGGPTSFKFFDSTMTNNGCSTSASHSRYGCHSNSCLNTSVPLRDANSLAVNAGDCHKHPNGNQSIPHTAVPLHIWHSSPYNTLHSDHQADSHGEVFLDSNPSSSSYSEQSPSFIVNQGVTSKLHYPSAEEELYARFLEKNPHGQVRMSTQWNDIEDEDLAIIEQLQNLSLAKTHAV